MYGQSLLISTFGIAIDSNNNIVLIDISDYEMNLDNLPEAEGFATTKQIMWNVWKTYTMDSLQLKSSNDIWNLGEMLRELLGFPCINIYEFLKNPT